MVIFYKKWKKHNEIQLTKNKMDLNIRKMINNPPSPEILNQSFNLSNFIKFFDLYKNRSLECGCCTVANSARTDPYCAVHAIFKLVHYADDQTFTQ